MERSLKVKRAFELNGLRKEKKTGIILLVLVNMLLLIFNFTDIKILWFGFYAPDQFNMMKFVHEGTGLLLISILMSIGILLYLFRKNQNFYSKNKWLKFLSFAWITQNSILCVSVILRNYYYIYYNGLAYKRIWLFAFLALTIVGLITLIIKIKKLKSFYYLLNVNTWSVYFVLVVLSFFNWDMIIAKTNLSHWNGSGIDIDFYLELSPETYPLIYANLDNIEKQMEDHKQTGVRWVSYWDINSFKNALDIRQKEFIKKYEQHTWPSWNLPDEHAYSNLLNSKKAELTFKQFK